MCPRTYYSGRGLTDWAPAGPADMDFGLYRRLIEEGAESGLKSVKLNFLGEPLLYPRIVDMVRLAAGSGLWVMMNTNATLLSPDLAKELLLAGLSDIFFSFDSPYPEDYERVRVGASFAKVLGNIRSLMSLKKELGLKHVQTRASMVLPEEAGPDLADKTKSDYIKLFRDLEVAEIGFGLPSVMGRDYRALPAPDKFVCPDLFRRMFVFNDGIVGPCCGDWERGLVVGDVRSSSLASIWSGREYQELRRAHLEGRYRDVETCAACSVPHLSTRPA
jgi:MoaA/NifB/PqqE/SkfB family radical SAM enzyme